ncbi:MAG: hypothetical protein ACTHJM_10815 [Marmoricola sp.]
MKRVLVFVASLAAVMLAAAPVFAELPIPSVQPPIGPAFIGQAATAQPLPHNAVPQNPYLGRNGYDSMHNDAYSSNGYEVSGPLGRSLKLSSATYGVSECATIAFDSRGRIVGLCGGLQGFSLSLIDPTTLHRLASMTTSVRSLTQLQNPFTDLCGGTYFYLDGHDRAWVLNTKKQIMEVQVTATGFTLLRTYDASAYVPDKDCMIATMPDWNGNIFFATKQARVGVINPTTGAIRTMQFGTAAAPEEIENSISGDETGGIYVVTDHRLASVAADAVGAPVVRWQTPYDRGTRQKPGQLSQGTGTTPALLGSDLVAITDNADPQMHVQFYYRTGPNAGQLICQAPVFAPGQSDTENSLTVADGNSVIVENNYGYTGPTSTTLGKTTAPGVAKVVLTDDHRCVVAWTNPISAPTSVPKISWGNGLVYVYSKATSTNKLNDDWYFTAINARTGATVWKRFTGNGIQWNNHYASIYIGPDGAAYISTLMGLVRLKDG